MEAMDFEQYMLPRNRSETQRLNIQHEVWTKNIGYLLHPTITTSLPKSHLQIADIGTGSGIWLSDIRDTLPKDTELVGFDISPDQFPDEDGQDSNLRFVVLDCFKPFPDEWHNTFDVVHVRLLASLMGPGKWEELARNLVMLLKPGGYLQWTETNFHEMFKAPLRYGVSQAHESIENTGMYKLVFLVKDFFNDPETKKFLDVEGLLELPAILRKLGLNSVGLDVASSDRLPETRKLFAWTIVGAVSAAARSMAKSPRSKATAEEVEGLIRSAEKEMETDIYVQGTLRVVTGRKPPE